MPGPLLIFRAYQLKRALKRLEKAKDNALRVHNGKRPRYPFYEEFFFWSVECLKNYFCKAFCPCCVHRKKMKEGGTKKYSENFLRRPCLAGSFENYAIKSLLGFFFGLLCTTFIFFFLIYQLNINPKATTLLCCFVGLVLTNGLAFSSEFRCMTMLTIPSIFSSRGRTALMAYTYILVMSGPAKNVLRNANILVFSLNCGQELIIKQTKAILKSIFAPLIAIIDVMRDILKALKEFARMMKNAFIAIRDLFLEILNAIKVLFKWLASVVNVCSSKYGSPYQRCNKAFDTAIEDCRVKMGIFKFLCYIVSAIKYVCEISRIVDVLCKIPSAIKTGIIDPLQEYFKSFSRYMYYQFYVNVTFVHYYNYSLEQSKSFRDIRGDIQEEVRQRTEWFMTMIDWSDLSMGIFFFILIFKACVYRIRYLTSDSFDNVYITYHVEDIDDRRSAMGKETILPLTFRERKKYVFTFSVRMVASERKKFTLAGTLLLMSGLQMCFTMILDYALYQLLLMLRSFGQLAVKGQLPPVIQIQVKGDGVMADMYRQMVTQFDPLMRSTPEFDTKSCLPDPIPIDLDKYQKIGILYALCFILAFTESYGLRLRHVICGCYYPEREKYRAVWLYNHILKTRGGLRRFLQRAIRRKVFGDDTLEKISLMDRICASSVWIEKIAKACGYVRIYCICCNEPGHPDDRENFKRCITPRCKGIYCYACFDDIQNICTLCMKPVEYGDFSDFSEEKDSSEEEERMRIAQEMKSADESDSSDEEDYAYQYDERQASSTDDDIENGTESIENSVPTTSKKQLATINDFSESDEEDEFEV